MTEAEMVSAQVVSSQRRDGGWMRCGGCAFFLEFLRMGHLVRGRDGIRRKKFGLHHHLQLPTSAAAHPAWPPTPDWACAPSAL
jgi:hypothetical protein